MSPMSSEAAGLRNAAAALLATSPPTQPLALIEASGLPKRIRVIVTAISPDARR